MAASSSSKYFNRYIAAAMSYGFARTLVRTGNAMIVEKPEVERNMLITERTCAIIGSSILGPYLSPFYFVSDMCALEKFLVAGLNTDVKPHFIGIPDAIFDFRY